MALIKINFFSRVLGMPAEVNVVIPQKALKCKETVENTGYKCLYLLHGLGDDHTT